MLIVRYALWLAQGTRGIGNGNSLLLHFTLPPSRFILPNCYNDDNQMALEFPLLFLYIVKNVCVTSSVSVFWEDS